MNLGVDGVTPESFQNPARKAIPGWDSPYVGKHREEPDDTPEQEETEPDN